MPRAARRMCVADVVVSSSATPPVEVTVVTMRVTGDDFDVAIRPVPSSPVVGWVRERALVTAVEEVVVALGDVASGDRSRHLNQVGPAGRPAVVSLMIADERRATLAASFAYIAPARGLAGRLQIAGRDTPVHNPESPPDRVWAASNGFDAMFVVVPDDFAAGDANCFAQLRAAGLSPADAFSSMLGLSDCDAPPVTSKPER